MELLYFKRYNTLSKEERYLAWGVFLEKVNIISVQGGHNLKLRF